VQGFVPRPRFNTPGFGRLEGIFPRAHASGSAAGGRVQYMAAGEYDYERIPVPGVTDTGGADLVDHSAIFFGRFDAKVSDRNDFMLTGEVAARRLSGRVEERPVVVADAEQRTVRSVEFGPAAAFGARDRPVAIAIRDVWQVGPRVQVESGARVDHSRHGG